MNKFRFPYFGIIGLFAIAAFSLSSCGKKTNSSATTGWNYNDPKWGGFEKHEYPGQETAPGLVLVEGGTFTMGSVEQDVTLDFNNVARRVTVSSFYLDETELTNIQYREYLSWLTRVYSASYPEVMRKALPDTLVWRDKLTYNEPWVEYYFRHPAFQDYPVVGINWLQANDYCRWRTDRVNEYIMVRDGYLDHDPMGQVDANNFNTEAYLYGQYEGIVKKNMVDYSPSGTGERKVRMEDGLLLPEYRLPTEAEWEYAALSNIGNNPAKGEENNLHKKIYSWNGYSMRESGAFGQEWHGAMLANFKRGAGDNMGVAGGLNDGADITAPVKQFMPNDFGLYNMAGNVSEWVMDIYRPQTSYEEGDFNSFRGNVFRTKVLDEEYHPVEKDSLGRISYRDVTDSESITRRNYKKGDLINFNDGDTESEVVYNYGTNSLINNHTRVFKGGSWNDRAYFLAPGSRRFLEEDQATATIGFRCAMARLGAPEGNEFMAGKSFVSNKKRKR